MKYDYQVAVLGGGPGGYEAALDCARYGLKTVLIEARELGGTCLNRGCIPTKALLHGAEVWGTLGNAATFGISTGERTLDYAALVSYKDKQVAKLRRGIEALEKAGGVTVLHGFGRLMDVHTLSVGEEMLTVEKVILATGSEPARPAIPGIEYSLTSDEVLSMTALPQSAVIIGGGVIGMEFTTLLHALGSKVTVLEMMPDILPGIDPKLNKLLRGVLRKVKLINSAKVQSISADHTVVYELNGEVLTVQAECCIVCVGRRPLTRGIGLEDAGVVTERGYVLVDEKMRTSIDSIYAIGDITGKVQLAHVATAQGHVAAANCANMERMMEERLIPACIYTHPEIAWIGVTEDTARAQGREVITGSCEVAANGRATVMNERIGTVKLVADAMTRELLGCQIMAPRATDMIAEAAVVMKHRGLVEELADTIHPHPTISEIIMTAARSMK